MRLWLCRVFLYLYTVLQKKDDKMGNSFVHLVMVMVVGGAR